MQQNIVIFDNIAIIRIILKHVRTTLFSYQLFSFRLARPIICVITRNRNNEFILGEKTLPISKRGELEIELEFECNGFDYL